MAVRECVRCAWEHGTSPRSMPSDVAVWALGVAQRECLHHVFLHICDFSIDVKLEHTTHIKFYVKLGKSGADNFKMIQRAYGNEAMSRARCLEWYTRFMKCITWVEDDERSGRTSKIPTPKNVETIRRLVHENRSRTNKNTAAIVNFSYGTVQTILTCDLHMHRVNAKFVPRLLTPNKKSTVSQFVKSFVSVPGCRTLHVKGYHWSREFGL